MSGSAKWKCGDRTLDTGHKTMTTTDNDNDNNNDKEKEQDKEKDKDKRKTKAGYKTRPDNTRQCKATLDKTRHKKQSASVYVCTRYVQRAVLPEVVQHFDMYTT